MEIAIALLQHYSFDLGGYSIRDLIRTWEKYKPEWVRQAVIESLFRGRYKAVSVNQILQLWERKGEPNCRYNHEFERLVCGDVAVIYEDRIYYTSPRNSNHPVPIAETHTSTLPLAINPPFPHRSMLGNLKIPTSLQVSAPKLIHEPQPQKHFGRQTMPSGTTASLNTYPTSSKAEYSDVYRSAYENMTLLAEGSMFVDKLRSMCGDRLALPAPEIISETAKVKLTIEN